MNQNIYTGGLDKLRIAYRDYTVPLVAGVPYLLNVNGNYWQVLSASGNAAVMLEFDESQAITRNAGTGGPAAYSTVRLTSAVNQTVVVSLGFTGGLPPYDRSTAGFSGATFNLAYAVPAASTDLPDVSVPSLGTAVLTVNNANRRALIIHNPTTSAGPVRIGGASVGAARGHLLEVGADLAIEGTQGLTAYNPNGVDVVLSLLDQTL